MKRSIGYFPGALSSIDTLLQACYLFSAIRFPVLIALSEVFDFVGFGYIAIFASHTVPGGCSEGP